MLRSLRIENLVLIREAELSFAPGLNVITGETGAGKTILAQAIGLLLGAPVAGAAIDLARPYLDATDGYQVLWPVCGIPILAAIPLVYQMMKAEQTGKAEPTVV